MACTVFCIVGADAVFTGSGSAITILDRGTVSSSLLSSTGSLISSSIGSLEAASLVFISSSPALSVCSGSCFCFMRSSDLAFVTAVHDSCVN